MRVSYECLIYRYWKYFKRAEKVMIMKHYQDTDEDGDEAASATSSSNPTTSPKVAHECTNDESMYLMPESESSAVSDDTDEGDDEEDNQSYDENYDGDDGGSGDSTTSSDPDN